MGLVLMSERELNRLEVLGKVIEGRMTVGNAANLLSLSNRQIYRLVKTVTTDGAAAIRHKARGRPSNHKMSATTKEFAMSLVKEKYADFGPTLAAERLEELHELKVSRETLRKWMSEAGLWLSRRQRRTFHQPRLRRECLGELIQIDGSDHRWFEDRGPRCTLLVFIDDATSTLMQLRFVKSESTFSYFEALELYLAQHGRPVAFYSDKHTVFRVSKQDAKSGHGMTQFGRALNALNIEPDRLREVFCLQDQRYVSKQLTFSFERKRIMLKESDITRGLVGKYVDTFVFPDGRFEVKWKGVSLPYTVFAKDKQRVTHAAIVENKHLSAVLAYAKEIQDKEGAPKAKPAGKQRTRYKPTGKTSPGRKSFVDRHIEAKQVKEKVDAQ